MIDTMSDAYEYCVTVYGAEAPISRALAEKLAEVGDVTLNDPIALLMAFGQFQSGDSVPLISQLQQY